MITSASEAWILHRSWSQETSAELTLFTADLGLVHALCKGGRTPSQQAFLQPFMPLWVAFNVYPNRYYIRRLESQAPSLTLTGHALFAGLYMNELLYYALRPAEAYPELYAAYTEALQALVLVVDKTHLEALLRRFEWVLLRVCGYGLSLGEDANTLLPIEPDKHYQYLEGHGLVQANTGILGEHILPLLQDTLDSPNTLKAAKYIMRKAINHFLDGRVLKTRALFS